MNSSPHRNPYERYSGLAIQMLVVILAGVVGGVKLDRWLGWTIPVCTILLSAGAIALAIYIAVRTPDKNHPHE